MPSIQEYLAEKRLLAAQRIREILSESFREASGIYGDEAWLFELLADYATSGKMLRAALVFLGYEALTSENSRAPVGDDGNSVLDTAAAIELLQAGLLVHDDIMDKDEIRRGKPTLHIALEERLRELNRASLPSIRDYPSKISPIFDGRIGESLAICAGDIYYFIAFKLLAKSLPARSQLFPLEMIKVCLAQMQDVQSGNAADFPSIYEALKMYTYKTARYTIALPLMAGAALAGADENSLNILENFGEKVGALFQLQDDSLGLFADSAQLGKPIGSDIREGKKTPHMVLLLPLLNAKERIKFFDIFGNSSVEPKDIEYIRGLVVSHGIQNQVDELAMRLIADSKKALYDADFLREPPKSSWHDLFNQLITYSTTRKY